MNLEFQKEFVASLPTFLTEYRNHWINGHSSLKNFISSNYLNNQIIKSYKIFHFTVHVLTKRLLVSVQEEGCFKELYRIKELSMAIKNAFRLRELARNLWIAIQLHATGICSFLERSKL